MPKPEAKSLPPSKIAEVKAFLKCAEELAELRELFPVVFAKLDELAVRYNATLEAAKEATKLARVSCGPFDLYQFTRVYDGAVLYETVGRQKFPSMGGMYAPEKCLVDKTRFDALVAQGIVRPEVAACVLTWQPAFHTPVPLSVPK